MDPITVELVSACELALALLDGVAAEDERNGKRNAALNVRECERRLQAAVSNARKAAEAKSADGNVSVVKAKLTWSGGGFQIWHMPQLLKNEAGDWVPTGKVVHRLTQVGQEGFEDFDTAAEATARMAELAK